MRAFIDRGGVWVAVQFVWFAAIVLVGMIRPDYVAALESLDV